MIASIVVAFHVDSSPDAAIQAIASRTEVALGDFQTTTRRLPAIIDASEPQEVEATTRWLQSLPDVAMVDVVCVFMEEAAESAPPRVPTVSPPNARPKHAINNPN